MQNGLTRSPVNGLIVAVIGHMKYRCGSERTWLAVNARFVNPWILHVMGLLLRGLSRRIAKTSQKRFPLPMVIPLVGVQCRYASAVRFFKMSPIRYAGQEPISWGQPLLKQGKPCLKATPRFPKRSISWSSTRCRRWRWMTCQAFVHRAGAWSLLSRRGTFRLRSHVVALPPRWPQAIPSFSSRRPIPCWLPICFASAFIARVFLGKRCKCCRARGVWWASRL